MGTFASTDGCDQSWSINGTNLIRDSIEYNKTKSDVAKNLDKKEDDHALKYIAKCLEEKNDDKLALLHTRHIECVQRYSDMMQGDDSQRGNLNSKRPSFFSRRKV